MNTTTNIEKKFALSNNRLLQKTPVKSVIKYIIMNKWLYLLLLPGTLYLIIFHYIPMYGIIIAFKNFNIVKGIWASKWVGLNNFRYLFTSGSFYEIFSNSLMFSILRLLWGFPVPIILALLLNEVRKMAFKKTVQTVIYIPHFISWVVIAGIMANLLSATTTGVVNTIIQKFGIEPINFLIEPKYFRSIVIIGEIWKESGWGTIIYLAALSGIDESLYEAAIVDGANRMRLLWHITLPGIMSTIIVLLILRMGHVLSNGFEQIFLLYSPMVYEVADVFETYTYRVGLQEGRFSYASAVGLFQSLVGFILIITTNRLSKSAGEGSLW